MLSIHDFNDNLWEFKIAIVYIFFADSIKDRTANEEDILNYLTASLVGQEKEANTGNLRLLKEKCEKIATHLKNIDPEIHLESTYPPIVWTNIAIDFWLTHGGRGNTFIDDYIKWRTENQTKSWIKTVNNDQQTESPNKINENLPIDIFILSKTKKPRLLNKKFNLLNPSNNSINKIKSDKDSIPHPTNSKKPATDEPARQFIKALINQAATEHKIRHLTGKNEEDDRFKYKGRRIDLHRDLVKKYPDIKKYTKSVIIKEISKFVKCRK